MTKAGGRSRYKIAWSKEGSDFWRQVAYNFKATEMVQERVTDLRGLDFLDEVEGYKPSKGTRKRASQSLSGNVPDHERLYDSASPLTCSDCNN